MEERKSMGGALVDVFDAAVVLVKSEINAVLKKVGAVAKEKGVGVVLLLGALAPLTLAAIFLILFVFYGLMRLGLGAWAAALIIGLLSLAAAAAMVMLGIQKLSAEVDTDMPRHPVPVPTQPNAPVGLLVGSPAAAVPGSAGGGIPLSEVRVPVSGNGQGAAYGTVGHTGAYSGAGLAGTAYTDDLSPNFDQAAYHPEAHADAHGHHAEHDPNIQHPVVLENAPGITVSTTPTYRDDMNRGEK